MVELLFSFGYKTFRLNGDEVTVENVKNLKQEDLWAESL